MSEKNAKKLRKENRRQNLNTFLCQAFPSPFTFCMEEETAKYLSHSNVMPKDKREAHITALNFMIEVVKDTSVNVYFMQDLVFNISTSFSVDEKSGSYAIECVTKRLYLN